MTMIQKNNALTARTESNTADRIAALNAQVARVNQMLEDKAPQDEQQGTTVIRVNSAIKSMNKLLSEANDSMAIDYYKAHKPVEVVKAGRSIPALALSADDETGLYSLVDVYAYPTLQGMKDWLPENTPELVDALRRVAAYVGMDGMEGRSIVLTGGIDAQGKKVDAPNKKVAELIKGMKMTKGEVKECLKSCIQMVCDFEVKPQMNAAFVDDFCQQMVKAGKEWGTRQMASQSHAGDRFLEYVYMVLNGQTKFTVVIK